MALKIDFKATKKQGEALKYLLDGKTTEIGYGGAAGGGKSYLGVFWVRFMALRYPQTRWFLGRKELTNLNKSTVATYWKMLQDYNVPKYAWGKMDGKNNIIKFDNGSQIYLLDLAYKPADPMYARLGSIEFTGGFVDESAEVDARAIAILKTRIGRQMNKEYNLKPKILETFNPDKGHVYTDYYLPWKKGELPEHKIFIPSKVTDNPHIPKEYIEQLERSDEITRQRLLFGNFDYDDRDNKLFRTDEVMDLFTAIIDEGTTTYISADIARQGKDSTKIMVWKGLNMIRCVTLQGATTDVVGQRIKDLEFQYNVHRHNIVVDSDGLGAGVADNLRGCYNFHNGASPIETDIVGKSFANLKTQCYEKLRFLAEKRMVRINLDGEEKDKLILELENILLKDPDKDKPMQLESKEDMKKRLPQNMSPDTADAVMMRMVYEIEGTGEVKTYKAVYDSYEE